MKDIILFVVLTLISNFCFCDEKIYNLKSYPGKYGTLIVDENEWEIKGSSGKAKYRGNGKDGFIVLYGMEGKSTIYPVTFEFMICRNRYKSCDYNDPHWLSSFLSKFFLKYNNNSVLDWIDLFGTCVDDYSELGEDYYIKRGLGWHSTMGYCEGILLSNKQETFVMLTWIDISLEDQKLRNELFEKVRRLVMNSPEDIEN